MTHQVKFQRSLISCYACALCVGVGYPITIRFSFFVSLTANSSHHHSRRHTEWRKWKDIDYLSPLVVYSCRRYFFFLLTLASFGTHIERCVPFSFWMCSFDDYRLISLCFFFSSTLIEFYTDELNAISC